MANINSVFGQSKIRRALRETVEEKEESSRWRVAGSAASGFWCVLL